MTAVLGSLWLPVILSAPDICEGDDRHLDLCRRDRGDVRLAVAAVRTGCRHPVFYRRLAPTDDVDAITSMLHEAYAPLAAAGMRFFASFQDSGDTERRIGRGDTIVALVGQRLVGIITLVHAQRTNGSPLYDRPDVASFQQFAVRPSYQRRGIGRTLVSLVEARARAQGVAVLALDTSERAHDLIAMYARWGYGFVEYVQWDRVNYRSVILAKTLAGGRRR